MYQFLEFAENSLKNDTTVILTEKSDFLKYLNKSR